MEFPKFVKGYWIRALVIVAAVLACSLPAKTKRIVPRRHYRPAYIMRKVDATTSYFYNWAGYAVTGPAGSVTDVKSSWIVPAVNCSPAPAGYSAFWAGIDGWNSNTVEQIGTDSDCVNLLGTQSGVPTYYAWFEFYPQFAFLIGNYTSQGVCQDHCVYPEDVMTAEVTGNPSNQLFTATINDLTEHWSFTTSSVVPGALQTSAEWIAETPFGCPTDSGFCYLSDFGSVKFGAGFTGIPSTSYATVGGKTGDINSFGNNVQEAIMVQFPLGAFIMAQPTSLFHDGTSFAVSWANKGP